MTLDLDTIERFSKLQPGSVLNIDAEEIAALVKIARAAVAWRESCYDGQFGDDLVDALREAGL